MIETRRKAGMRGTLTLDISELVCLPINITAHMSCCLDSSLFLCTSLAQTAASVMCSMAAFLVLWAMLYSLNSHCVACILWHQLLYPVNFFIVSLHLPTATASITLLAYPLAYVLTKVGHLPQFSPSLPLPPLLLPPPRPAHLTQYSYKGCLPGA